MDAIEYLKMFQDRLEDWVDENATDMGELGVYIRTEYIKNGIEMQVDWLTGKLEESKED